jgi:hypothetical protein
MPAQPGQLTLWNVNYLRCYPLEADPVWVGEMRCIKKCKNYPARICSGWEGPVNLVELIG